MPVADLLHTLRDLDRADKWRVLQFLLQELAREEGALLDAGQSYPVWSPYNAVDAANTLLAALEAEKTPYAER